MAEQTTKAKAIKEYFESGDTGRRVEMSEMMEFKRACTSEEWLQFARDAAGLVGKELLEG